MERSTAIIDFRSQAASHGGHFRVRQISQVVHGDGVRQALSVRRVNEPQVLTEDVLPVFTILVAAIGLAVLVLEVIESIVDVAFMAIDELLDRIHGVGVIHAGTRPAVTGESLGNLERFVARLFGVEQLNKMNS